MHKTLLAILTLFAVLPFSVNAGELLRNDVSYSQGKYHMNVEVAINASKEKIVDILTDYKNLNRIHPKIIKSGARKNAAGQMIVHSTIRDCVLLICQNIINTQLVYVKKNSINANTIAKESNLKDGYMKWQFTEHKGKTHIAYSAMLEPNFFIPPIIGPAILKNRLSQDVEIWIKNIETLATQ